MSNKKGFSLVEVLVVVAVLSIILSIAVPRVLVSMENVRKETFRSGATSIVNTVKLEYSQMYKKITKPMKYSFLNGDYEKNSPKLKLKGDLPSIGDVYLSVDGKIALAVVSNDKKYCAKKGLEDSEVTIEDYIAGKCKLNISDDIVIGEKYFIDIIVKDENVWTNDSKQVTITSSSKDETKIKYQYSTENKIDNSNWKDYTGEFIVKQNGTVYAKLVNTSDDDLISDSKKVTRIDKTKPECKFSITGTKGSNDYYTSDTVVLNMNSSDKGGSGVNTKLTKIDNTDVNSLTIKDDGTTKVSGTVYDIAGNKNTCETTVNKDSQQLTCDIQLASGEEGNDPWYKSNVSLKVVGNSGVSKITSIGISTSSTTSYVSQTLTVTKDGSTTVYGYVKNGAGKTAKCTATIQKDSTPPTCSYSGESTTWTKNNRTIKTNCSDSTSGCDKSSVSTLFNKTTKTSSISNVISDKAGNTTTCTKTANVYVDKTKPILGSATFTNLAQASYKITITGSDSNSGVKNYSYSVKGGNSKSSTTSKSFSANKVDQITVKILDNAGNSNSKNYTLNAIDAYIRQLYKGALSREADTTGFNYWKGEYKNFLKLNGGKSINDLIIGIYTSSEAKTNLNTNTKFVNAMYTGILGRSADSGGLSSFVSKLNGGTSRKDLLNQFMGTTEFKTLVAFYNFAESVSYNPSTYTATTNYTCPDYWSFDGVSTCSTTESYSCTVACTKKRGYVLQGRHQTIMYYSWNGTQYSSDRTMMYTNCVAQSPGLGTAWSTCDVYKWSNELINTTCDSTCERQVTQTVTTSYSCDDNATLKGTTCYYCPKGGTYNSSTNKCVIE